MLTYQRIPTNKKLTTRNKYNNYFRFYNLTFFSEKKVNKKPKVFHSLGLELLPLRHNQRINATNTNTNKTKTIKRIATITKVMIYGKSSE